MKKIVLGHMCKYLVSFFGSIKINLSMPSTWFKNNWDTKISAVCSIIGVIPLVCTVIVWLYLTGYGVLQNNKPKLAPFEREVLQPISLQTNNATSSEKLRDCLFGEGNKKGCWDFYGKGN